MGNVIQDFEFGKPSVSIRWPKDTVVQTEAVKNSDGRFIARVYVNDDPYFDLPGTHPTGIDALITLAAYVAENTYKEES